MNRRYYPYWDWECYHAGFFNYDYPIDKQEGLLAYKIFLSNLSLFEKNLQKVLNEWPLSCEQFLSNQNINRIAWLGQAAMCIYSGLPSCYRGGFKLMTKKQQKDADNLALKYLNIWLNKYEKEDKQIYFNLEETRI